MQGGNQMKIHIESSGEDVMTLKDYTNIQDRGEISHFIAELKLIELELLELWSETSQSEVTPEDSREPEGA